MALGIFQSDFDCLTNDNDGRVLYCYYNYYYYLLDKQNCLTTDKC